jgi:hypothetical protein
VNYKKIKKQFMSKIGFMKWGKLNAEALEFFNAGTMDDHKEIWLFPDVSSLWVAFDDGYGTGYNKVNYSDMEDYESPVYMLSDAVMESYDYNEGATGKILNLIEGYGYKAGNEIAINSKHLESWRNFV